MYFCRGNLPWQERYLGGLKGGSKEDKYRRILDKKESTPLEILGKAAPSELNAYLNYVRNLSFEDRPDYAWCRWQFIMIINREASSGFDRMGDWDWDLRYIHEKEENAARYGDAAVDHELALADKLRRDGDRSRKQAPIFHKTGEQTEVPPKQGNDAQPAADSHSAAARVSEASGAEGEPTAATVGTPVSRGPKYWAEGKVMKAEDEKPEVVQFNSPIGAAFTIGRAANNDLSLAVPAVSVSHCSLRLQDDGEAVVLADTSLNGTFINGTLVGKGNEAVIPNGAVITFIKNKSYPQLVLRMKT